MTVNERKELRKLQDRAIKGIELLLPDIKDLDSQRPTAEGPTVGEARKYLFPDLKWCWELWIN